MKIRVFLLLGGVAVFVWSCAVVETSAQVQQVPQGQVVLSKLSPPAYPPLARAARVAGDVEIALHVRQDGSVESAEVVKGNPLLKEAALDSALRSKFECRGCGETSVSYSVLYTFGYTTDQQCCQSREKSAAVSQPPESQPGVAQLQNHVTILSEPFCICDPGPDVVKVRSAKCLFLWHCGKRYGL